MRTNKKVAIVILNWNGKAWMEKFLPSVLKYSPNAISEIIVADNGSTDNSLSMLSHKFPTVKIIRLEKNYGFAEGYNRAIKQVDTPYCVLLNSDVEVTEGWLDAPLALLEKEESIAAVQPKILSERNRHLFEYAGACGGYMDKYGYPFCRGRIFQEIETDHGQYDSQADVLWASGACLFIKTEVYIKEGGLDNTFFAHQEEIDLCWRLRMRGYRIVCTPQSKVYHVGGGTLNSESPHKTFLNFRNNLLMLYKNLPEKDLTWVLRLRTLLDYVAAFKFLLEGHWQNAIAVHKARKNFHRLIPLYKSKRNENQASVIQKEMPELKSYCLLWQFYIKRRIHYNELPQ